MVGVEPEPDTDAVPIAAVDAADVADTMMDAGMVVPEAAKDRAVVSALVVDAAVVESRFRPEIIPSMPASRHSCYRYVYTHRH